MVYMAEVTVPEPHGQEMLGPLSRLDDRAEIVLCLGSPVDLPLATARGAPGSLGPCGWIGPVQTWSFGAFS